MNSREPVTIAQRTVSLPDPQDCTDNADSLALLEALFDALVRRGMDGRFHPALAESWTLSDDARLWRFTLRPGLTFHDGSPIDAEVMRASISRMQRPDVGATLGAPAVWGQYLGGARITAVDTRVLEVETVEPCADLLDVLVSGYALPPDRIDQAGFLKAPVGSGAYRFVDWGDDGTLILAHNPDWWGGPVANPHLAFIGIPDRTQREDVLLAGHATIGTKLSPHREYGPDLTCVPHIDPTAILYLLNAARGPFTDPNLRRAVNLAVDREVLIDRVLGGAGRSLHGFVSPAHLGAVAVDPSEGYDLDMARRLLSEAGFPDGLMLEVDCPTRLPDEAFALTDALGEQLQRIGITLRRHVIEDRTAYAEAVRDKRIHDMCLFDSSPMSTFRVLYEKIDSRQAGAWWQGYSNPEVEARLDAARMEPDPVKREDLHKANFNALRRDPPWLTLYNHLVATVIRGGHDGWHMRPDGILDVTRLPPLTAT
jgi:peptide/nickel transport system substrate-binding protein